MTCEESTEKIYLLKRIQILNIFVPRLRKRRLSRKIKEIEEGRQINLCLYKYFEHAFILVFVAFVCLLLEIICLFVNICPIFK